MCSQKFTFVALANLQECVYIDCINKMKEFKVHLKKIEMDKDFANA